MSTLSSANVTDINLVLKERTHMRLCLNMLIFTHNLGNWLIASACKVNNQRMHQTSNCLNFNAILCVYFENPLSAV